MRFAVVDDDHDVRTALIRLLSAMGHDVIAFASAEAFEAAADTVDCAIVDVRLPGRSGFELREWLRARRPPIPAVLISGDVYRLAPDAWSVADGPVVTKPFDVESLEAAIRVAITAPGLRPAHHESH